MQAQVDAWIDFSTTELDGPLGSWLFPILGFWPYDKKVRFSAQNSLVQSAPYQKLVLALRQKHVF